MTNFGVKYPILERLAAAYHEGMGSAGRGVALTKMVLSSDDWVVAFKEMEQYMGELGEPTPLSSPDCRQTNFLILKIPVVMGPGPIIQKENIQTRAA